VETSSKEDEIHPQRVQKAQRDKPMGRRRQKEMHTTPENEPIMAGEVGKSGDNLVVLRFQLPGM